MPEDAGCAAHLSVSVLQKGLLRFLLGKLKQPGRLIVVAERHLLERLRDGVKESEISGAIGRHGRFASFLEACFEEVAVRPRKECKAPRTQGAQGTTSDIVIICRIPGKSEASEARSKRPQGPSPAPPALGARLSAFGQGKDGDVLFKSQDTEIRLSAPSENVRVIVSPQIFTLASNSSESKTLRYSITLLTSTISPPLHRPDVVKIINTVPFFHNDSRCKQWII